jgi:hypothetical protein
VLDEGFSKRRLRELGAGVSTGGGLSQARRRLGSRTTEAVLIGLAMLVVAYL